MLFSELRKLMPVSRFTGSGLMKRWGWLIAPSLTDFSFALRTTITSLAALGIAFGMELGQPQWAAMTVWIVAQNTIGASLSKAHWRIVGTLLGCVAAVALISAAPQQPWVFFPLLACWVGLCTSLGTLFHNFRSYAFVLMAYTCAIISVSAVSEPDHVFEIAVARGTYIILGVVCEMVAGLLWAPGYAERAKASVRDHLTHIISETTSVVEQILRSHMPPERDLFDTFSGVMALNDTIEFSAIETGHCGPMIAFARATLGQAARFMSRAMGMRARLAVASVRAGSAAEQILHDFIDFLRNVPEKLKTDEQVAELRSGAAHLLEQCRESVEQNAVSELKNPEKDSVLRERIVVQGLILLLQELILLLLCFADVRVKNADLRSLRLTRQSNWRSAVANGVRSFLAVLVAAGIWEVTAWPQGTMFIMFVAVVCARFASFSNTVIASKNFLFGAVWAVIAAIIPVFFVMPVTADYPVFCLAAGIPMLIGGLVVRHPPLAAMGASFANFFPYMLEPENHFRVDELEWFNASFALLTGLGFGVLIFRYLLPFNLKIFHRNFSDGLMSGLRDIVSLQGRMTDQSWLSHVIEGMEQMIAHSARYPAAFVDSWLHRAFAVMTVGRNLLYVKSVLKDCMLPEQVRTELFRLFDILETRKRPAGEKLRALETSVRVLTRLEETETSIPAKVRISDILGCLLIAVTDFTRGEEFLTFRPGPDMERLT